MRIPDGKTLSGHRTQVKDQNRQYVHDMSIKDQGNQYGWKQSEQEETVQEMSSES